MSEISICIPTYEFKGAGVRFLAELFSSLEKQTFQDFDIVISDHSRNDEIKNYCQSTDFDILYVSNPNGRGYQSTNTNCALEHAEGRILKLIYQDDLFVDEQALEKIKNRFDLGCKWLFHGFTHTTDGVETHRDCVPRWCDLMLEGRNLLGSPSCIAFLNESKMYMDENIKLLIDTELYHRMRMKHGMPEIISDILIANREHDDRVSAGGVVYDIQFEHPEGNWLMNRGELAYISEKHSQFMKERRYPDD